MLESYYDLWVAGGLVAIALIVFFLGQIGLLPRKSLPFVAGALAGGLGLVILRDRRRRVLLAQLEDVRKEVKERDGRIDELQARLHTSEAAFAANRARLEAQVAAREKEILLLNARREEDRARIESLSAAELQKEFDAIDWQATR